MYATICVLALLYTVSCCLLQSKVTALCNEKSSWLELSTEASLTDIQEQTRDFQERFQPYLAKLNPPDN